MKKTLIALLILIITLTCSNWAVMAEENVNVVLDGETIIFDVPAQIINGRTMVPMRKIFEELGMAVEWFDETQTVMATKQGVVVEFPIGSTTVSRNTVEQTIDVPAQLVGSRTLVPVRFVSEFTGAEVIWDGDTNTVFINSKDNIKQLDWNDTYEYWGEVENGDASGYGALYNKEDGSLRQIGKYIDSKIVVGSDFFDSGATFNGNYENGKHAYGVFCFANGDSFVGEFKDGGMSDGTYNFSNGGYYTGKFDANEKFSNGTQYFTNGDSYTGEFVNGEFSNGTYNYANGSYHKTKWKNGLPNGYGILYDAVEDVQYEGNYVNGKREGDFVIKDFYLNQTYYATYRDGIYIDEAQKKQEEKNKRLEEINKKVNELAAEYEELDAWYENELEELYDYITNGDPFSTDWAKKIYENYGVNKYASPNSSSPADSNIDSFATANAMRQQAALQAKAKANADAAIISYNQTYINNRRQLINETYTQQKALLDKQRETLLAELDMLERY